MVAARTREAIIAEAWPLRKEVARRLDALDQQRALLLATLHTLDRTFGGSVVVLDVDAFHDPETNGGGTTQ